MNLSHRCLQALIPVQLHSPICACKAYYKKKKVKRQEQVLLNVHKNMSNFKPVSKKLKQTSGRK